MSLTTSRATTPAAQPDWSSALCAQTDPELFFPDGIGGAVHHRTKAAKKMCARCPVQPSCLDWALDTDQSYGVWGGTTDHERRLMRRRVSFGMRPVDDKPVWETVVETRAEEFRTLEASGLKAWQIGRRMRVDADTVHKVREALAGQGVKV